MVTRDPSIMKTAQRWLQTFYHWPWLPNILAIVTECPSRHWVFSFSLWYETEIIFLHIQHNTLNICCSLCYKFDLILLHLIQISYAVHE
jgi:hypothetical protein